MRSLAVLHRYFSGCYTPSRCRQTWKTSRLSPVPGTTNNGNVASITNNITTARSQSYTYDALNRVSTAQTVATSGTYAWGLSFGYDAWANLLTATVTQGSAYTLSVSATGKNQLSGYSYDAAGNMLNDGVNTYTYDAENHILTAAGVTYTYDGDGERVQKSSGMLYWYGDGSDALDETDTSGNLLDEYIFFGGARIARRDSSSNVDYYFADHLGSAHVVTNAAGTIQDDSDFYPYGGERSYTSSSGNTRKFTGKERDAESGLDEMGARYFGSSLGRFMTTDPIYIEMGRLVNPQMLNLYTYVTNNPLNFTDPSGLDVRLQCQSGDSKCSKKTVNGLKDDLNNRKGHQFKVKIGNNGLLQVDGKVDRSKLSSSEAQLYDAIKDKDHHATLNAVSESGTVQFGRFDGHGQNTADASDIGLVAKQDQQTAGEMLAHEAMEAYYSSEHDSADRDEAHKYADAIFGGGDSSNHIQHKTGTNDYLLTIPIPGLKETISAVVRGTVTVGANNRAYIDATMISVTIKKDQ